MSFSPAPSAPQSAYRGLVVTRRPPQKERQSWANWPHNDRYEKSEQMTTSDAGAALIAQINAALPENGEWDERELAILDLARRQANDIADLETVLAGQGPLVKGSMGQERLNPAFAELRQQRLALGRLLESIRLPDEGMGHVPDPKKSRAAATRWRAHNAGKAVT